MLQTVHKIRQWVGIVVETHGYRRAQTHVTDTKGQLDKVCQGSGECLNRREGCLEVKDKTAIVYTTELQNLCVVERETERQRDGLDNIKG